METVGAKKSDPLLGQAFKNGEYVIQRKLGDGAMGSVYAAIQVSTGREVAVKAINTEAEEKPGEAEARFGDEVVVLGKLNHPNIVKVVDRAVLDDGRPVIVMDLAPGLPLLQYTDREQKLEGALVVKIVMGVCAALQAAHERGIIHRDIKPANIMVLFGDTGEVHVTVLDFGIARWREKGSGLTTKNAVVGTPLYMSPEQLRAEDLDARSDVYAVGCLVFTLICGRPPFQGEPLVVIGQHLNKDPPTFNSCGVTDATALKLEPVVRQAMAKSVAKRQGSAKQLAQELASVAGLKSLLNQRAPGATATLGTRAPVERDGNASREAETAQLAATAATSRRLVIERTQSKYLLIGGVLLAAALVILVGVGLRSPAPSSTGRSSSSNVAVTPVRLSDASVTQDSVVMNVPPMPPLVSEDVILVEDASVTEVADVSTRVLTESSTTHRRRCHGRDRDVCTSGQTDFRPRLDCQAQCVSGCWRCN